MGHSMGGVVSTALLPNPNISALITMSTPHRLPPARFDRRIAAIYAHARKTLDQVETPILSLCGGATDLLVSSESCILPEAERDVYRRSIITTALEGCWTGVGHQVMVWCHQVRWRVARAALELGAAKTAEEKGAVLDRRLADGHALPAATDVDQEIAVDLETTRHEVIDPERNLMLRAPQGSNIYLFSASLAPSSPTKFVLYVSGGTILSVGPRYPLPLTASVHICHTDVQDESPSKLRCQSLHPDKLKLLPVVRRDKPFPVPRPSNPVDPTEGGVDESEGIAFFEVDLSKYPEVRDVRSRRIMVELKGGDGRGWVIGGYVRDEPIVKDFSVHGTRIS